MNIRQTYRPECWGLRAGEDGQLMLGNHGIAALAHRYGTPVHVVNERRLRKTAACFAEGIRSSYAGESSIHFALKCNSVPGIIGNLKQAGLKAEVVTGFELELALKLGYTGAEIIANGPSKTLPFLRRCVDEKVKYIVVDSIEEIPVLRRLSEEYDQSIPLLLRVNPDFVPAGMNRGTATASRAGSWFGLDLRSGEVEAALKQIKASRLLRFAGYHFHIGTGIHQPIEYTRALSCLRNLRKTAGAFGMDIPAIDIGGGFGTSTSREYSSLEMLLYNAFGRLPCSTVSKKITPGEFGAAVSRAINAVFSPAERPELLCEPGRYIAGPNQFMLLSVTGVKKRPGVGTWIITDGGLSTVSMPTYYEHHEVFVCNDVNRPKRSRVTLTGPACFAADIVYRNLRFPEVFAGDTIAIMDTGAYFTALESSFGFYKPPILGIDGALCHTLRARETFEDAIGRDLLD